MKIGNRRESSAEQERRLRKRLWCATTIRRSGAKTLDPAGVVRDVSEARRGKAPARARCVRALSIQRLEGRRPRLRRTRALCKLNGVEGLRGGVLGSCGGAQQLTRWVAKW